MNKKTISVVSVVVLLVVIGLVNIQRGQEEEVKIGAILPISGSLAYTGEVAKTALEIAEKDHPNSGVSLVVEDDAFIPKNSVSAFNKLAQIDDVVAVIGPLNGSAIESVRSLAIQTNTTVFTPYGSGNDISDYLYKNSSEAVAEAGAMANKANELGYKKLAIMYLQTDFGYRYLKEFKNIVTRNGGTLVAEEGNPVGQTDYRSALLKIKEKNPDAIYIVNSSAPTGMIIKQAVELGIKTKFLSLYATESPEILQIGGKSIEGLIYTSLVDSSSLSKKQTDFIAEYKAKTEEAPQIIAYNIYDIYSILTDAVAKCKSDKVCINSYVKNVKDYDGVSGKFSIIDGKLVRDIYFMQVKDGHFVSLD